MTFASFTDSLDSIASPSVLLAHLLLIQCPLECSFFHSFSFFALFSSDLYSANAGSLLYVRSPLFRYVLCYVVQMYQAVRIYANFPVQ